MLCRVVYTNLLAAVAYIYVQAARVVGFFNSSADGDQGKEQGETIAKAANKDGTDVSPSLPASQFAC